MRREQILVAYTWMVASVIIVSSTFAMPPQSKDQSGAVQQSQAVAQESKAGITPERTGSAWPPTDLRERSSASFSGAAVNFVHDQKDIWTSPTHLRFSDTEWLVPLGGLTAGLMETDQQFSAHLSRDLSKQRHYRTLSNAGTAALVGVGGGLALWSTITHDAHQRETGFLAGEAAVDSVILVEALKYATARQRPMEGNGAGLFFHGGSSFPSAHAATGWSVAGVIAHEYPGPLPKLFAYGLASAVTVSRVRSRDHFPSDVLIGSAIGWLVSQQVYSKHHDPELGGSEWNSWSSITRSFESSGPEHRGSPYVPLDSWIYPALDRLAALGLVDSGFTGLRPWTRRECARLLGEATDHLSGSDKEEAEAARIVDALQREFRSEMDEGGTSSRGTLRLESLYSRTEHISGMPLTDGYDFAQTQINDFGRPYGEGWSTVNGFSAYASSGRWVVYTRGELQTAPSVPAFPLSTREFIAGADLLPLPPATPQPAVRQAVLMDTYVGLMLSNWQISFGRQSLWWGTGAGTSLELSNNAQPIDMFRINRTSPLKLPSILGWLGPMRTEFFLGRLSGYEFIFSPLGLVGQWRQALPNQPFMHGENISFKPTPNFEFGFYRTTIFGGEGYPFTPHALIASLFDTGNSPAGSANKPGKRTSGLDLSYRLPGLRNWATIYADGFTYDEFSPIAYPTWSAWHSGLYFSHLPRLPKLDLRVEGVYTDIPKIGGVNNPGTWYFNGTWRSGYTNNGNIMGSWVGRGGQGAQAWTNYWFNSRNRLQLNFRHQKVSQEFLPGGGTLTDAGMRTDFWIRPNLGVSAAVQYERWLFPVIRPNLSRNVAASLQITFQPHKDVKLGRLVNSGVGIGDTP